MGQLQFSRAGVLVFDPEPATRRANRLALEDLGFRRVAAPTDMSEFMDALEREAFELIVTEAFVGDAQVCDIVRALRDGDMGGNPFVTVLLTLWPRREADVRRALDSGADDMLLRPFSAGQLIERVRVLASSNRPYVVTSDYIGPDRRRASHRAADNLITAPNLLRAASEGGVPELMEAERAIPEARERVGRERVRRLAMRVATAARMRIEQGEAADAAGLEEIDRAARELRRRLRVAATWPEALSHANALTGATGRLLQRGAASDEELTRVRALAVHALEAIAEARETPDSDAIDVDTAS